MVKRKGSFRRRTRRKLCKPCRARGKVPTTKIMQTFEEGHKVVIKQEPSVHKGMPHPRFKGLIGVIVGMQGKSYKVRVRDGDSYKVLLAAPVHLQKHNG